MIGFLESGQVGVEIINDGDDVTVKIRFGDAVKEVPMNDADRLEIKATAGIAADADHAQPIISEVEFFRSMNDRIVSDGGDD